MICEFCGGETSTQKVRKQHWLHGKLYIVDNIEAEVCKECGERYFHAKTLDAIDNLIERRHPVKDRLEVEVISL